MTTDHVSPNRTALALLVVGLVLLPGPAYAIGLDRLDGPDEHRVSAGYVAEPIAAANDSVLADRYAGQVSFQPSDLEFRHVRDDYRAPDRTRDVLERAIGDGSATTDDGAVESDLRRIERNHTFLTVSFDAYYAYGIESTADATTVETTRANDSEIATAVREELVADYEHLPEAERTTFRKIRQATEADDQYDYRPWSDEPVPGEPIVERDGDYYAVEVASHTDDFHFPDGLFLGFGASIGGIVCLLLSGVIRLYDR